MDKLEEHIKKYRDDLDKYRPSSDVWKRISRATEKKKNPLIRWISIAAMAIIILGSVSVFYKPLNRWSVTGNRSAKYEEKSSDNPRLKETEIYYNNLVNSLYREAAPLLTGNPEIKNELSADFKQLDSICYDIKKDLKDNVANQEVIEALIQNYRIKIRLLEDMLIILKENKDNPEKNKSHEL